MVNLAKGKIRRVVYCGNEYAIYPGQQYGENLKQYWVVEHVGFGVIASMCVSLSKATSQIHRHAVEHGNYSALYAADFSKMVRRVKGKQEQP